MRRVTKRSSFSFYLVLSCWTQSKLPCGLSRATLVTLKVKILSSCWLSEQGTVILCSNRPTTTTTHSQSGSVLAASHGNNAAAVHTAASAGGQRCSLTPWLPLKQMVGCEDRPWREEMEGKPCCSFCVTHAYRYTHFCTCSTDICITDNAS